MLASSRSSDSSSPFTAHGRAGFSRGAFLCKDGSSTARLAQKADGPVSRQGWAGIQECTLTLKVCLRELVAPQRSGLQRIRLENVGFPQPPPEMEPVQLGGTEITPNPKRGVASVMGGGWREIFPCSNQCLCVLLMAQHWEEMSGGRFRCSYCCLDDESGKKPPCRSCGTQGAPAEGCHGRGFLGLTFGKVGPKQQQPFHCFSLPFGCQHRRCPGAVNLAVLSAGRGAASPLLYDADLFSAVKPTA